MRREETHLKFVWLGLRCYLVGVSLHIGRFSSVFGAAESRSAAARKKRIPTRASNEAFDVSWSSQNNPENASNERNARQRLPPRSPVKRNWCNGVWRRKPRSSKCRAFAKIYLLCILLFFRDACFVVTYWLWSPTKTQT